MIVVPGSIMVRLQAEAEGLDRIFLAAGAEWREPGCSMCLAMNGDSANPGDLVVSTGTTVHVHSHPTNGACFALRVRDLVVETNAQFRKDSVLPVVSKALPEAVLGLVRRVVEVQQMTLQAAIDKDVDLAFQALLNDALCRIPVDRAWEMFGELLQANKAMLPGWDL